MYQGTVVYIPYTLCILSAYFTFILWINLRLRIVFFLPLPQISPQATARFFKGLTNLDPVTFLKGTRAWNFCKNFFAEAESFWSLGPVTQDYWKSYSIRRRYSTFNHFRTCSACDEIGSAYAQHAMKFVPLMLSVRRNSFRVWTAWIVHVKAVHILPLGSLYAQCMMKSVPRMLSMECTCKNVHILPLAEHARKFVPRMVSMRWNRFRVCSACDKIVSAYAQHTHAIIFENDSKIPN